MRSVLANAVLVAGVVLLLCANAQPRGGARASGGFRGSYRSYHPVQRPRLLPRPTRPAATTSSSPRASSTGINFPPVTGTSLINPGEASCLLNPSFAGSFYCRQYFSGRPYLGIEPVYPFWLPSTGYDTEQPAAPAPEAEQDNQLAAQVGNLAAEVEMMREDQALRDSRGTPSPQPAMTGEEKPPTTLLVYRDGHQVEVQDYAIQGQTLWVFSSQMTRRVPLADLDLAATEHVNAERGVEFVPPDTK